MNIRRSDSPKNDFLSDIKAIIGALRLLAVLGLSIIVLFLIFWWDAGLEHPFVEVGPTEFSQTILLLLSTSLFFIEAFHRPEIRRALILVGGLTGCMLIREQDYFLDMLAHGCWKWPALALAFGCLACAAVNVRDTIAALAKQGGLYIEVGGGIRTEERIENYLSLGVGRCILGSVAVTDFAFTARMLQKYGDRIAVGVDAKDGYVAIHGWKEVSAEPGVDFCERLADAGCTAIIYTDIACDGAMRGTNLGLYRTLAKEVPGVAFTASGGISSEAELLELKEMGTAAAILGKSLYTGALDLVRCVQLVQE